MTLILLLPLCSGRSRKNFDEILLPASFTANSSDGSRTSQLAKLRPQKYLAGIPVAFSSSSNVSFLIPANLLVLKSVTIKDKVLGWTASTFSDMSKILSILKYWAYLPTVLCIVLRGLFSLVLPTKTGICRICEVVHASTQL